MTDSEKELVARLRDVFRDTRMEVVRDVRAAADAIERLCRDRELFLSEATNAIMRAEAAEAEVARLREALTPFVTITKTDGPVWYYENADDSVIVRCELTVGEIRQARATIGETK